MKRLLTIIAFLASFGIGYAQTGLGFAFMHTEEEVYEDAYENHYTIEHVFRKSPAEQAGLKAGDEIVKFDGALLVHLDSGAMANIVKKSPETVKLVIKRGGKQYDYTITKAAVSTYTNLCLEGNCTNGQGTFVDADGITYTGTFKNKKKDGKGKTVATNGDSYDGDWKNDKREGYGTYQSQFDPKKMNSRGWKYEGQWKNDEMAGKGKVTYLWGGFYEGEMANNYRNGKGKLVMKDNTVYDGIWKDNALNGQGTVQMPNGDVFTGNYVNGRLEGEATVYTKATNTSVRAQFKKGVRQ